MPYWGCAGLFFLTIFKLIFPSQIRIDIISFVINILGVMFVIALFMIFLYVLYRYFINNIKDLRLENQKRMKYVIFVISYWIGSIYAILNSGNYYLILYILMITVLGTLAEGILGIFIRKVYGERFWVYQKYSIIDKSTSLLILPFWSVLGILTIILVKVLGI